MPWDLVEYFTNTYHHAQYKLNVTNGLEITTLTLVLAINKNFGQIPLIVQNIGLSISKVLK